MAVVYPILADKELLVDSEDNSFGAYSMQCQSHLADKLERSVVVDEILRRNF